MTPMQRMQPASKPVDILRSVVGVIWLAGAVFNLAVTLQMNDPYVWIVEESCVAFWRRFFGEVVDENLLFWTVMLIIGEATLGVLTLARNGWAKAGLIGGAMFSAMLFFFGSVYTLVMGPYALLLVWLATHPFRRSIVDIVTRR